MKRHRHTVREMRGVLILQFSLIVIFSLFNVVSCGPTARSAQENLRVAYESVEEGNDHEAAIESVEAGLGGNGESSNELQTVEHESSALLNQLRQLFPVPHAEKPARALSKGLLDDLKVQALARLEKKIRSELEKETAEIGRKIASGPTAEPDRAPIASAHAYHLVRQQLTSLSWVC